MSNGNQDTILIHGQMLENIVNKSVNKYHIYFNINKQYKTNNSTSTEINKKQKLELSSRAQIGKIIFCIRYDINQDILSA
jgi:hypothetical protein